MTPRSQTTPKQKKAAPLSSSNLVAVAPRLSKKSVLFHRCRFVDHMPSAINALAFSPDSAIAEVGGSQKVLLACARENGDLELWNPIRWHLERVIPGIPGSTVESIVWIRPVSDAADSADDSDDSDVETKTTRSTRRRKATAGRSRLLTAGHDGCITEWDLVSLKPLARIESGGGAVWCMTATPDNDEVAVGCEDGSVRVFSVVGSPGTIEYKATFDRQDGRILSVAYHPTQPILATGSTDSCIRTYSTETRRCLSRSTLDTAGHEETLVWAITYLPDGTLVSGDSLGTVTFWDSVSRTVRRSIRAHNADVLCLAVNRAGDAVFSSGIDRKVVQYRSIDGTASLPSTAFHSHDVRAIALCEARPVDALVTGGVDTILTVSTTASSFPHSKQIRNNPFPQRTVVAVAEKARLVMCRYSDRVKVWALGEPVPLGHSLEELKGGERLGMASRQKFIAEIRVKCATNLTAAAISNDGTLIALSDLYTTKLFQLTLPKRNGPWPGASKKSILDLAKVTHIRSFPSPTAIPGSLSICFSPDSRKLVLGGSDSVVRIVDISGVLNDGGEGSVEVLAAFKQHAGEEGMVIDGEVGGSKGRELVSSLAVSKDGQWLATGDLGNRIHIFNLDALKHHATLPRFTTLHTAIAFHPTSPILTVTTSSNELYIYDAEDRRLTDWSREYSHRLPDRFVSRNEIIMGATTPPVKKGMLMVWASSYICHIDLEQVVVASAPEDIAPVSRGKKWDEYQSSFTMDHRFGPLMYFGFVGDGEAVAVELPLLSVVERLPPGFYRKRYGR
ncbi:WD40-repeat-containing domain protein [Chytridium lagenaria]|nr:WD40-repeat-containing domain protein [Chytridium lagenaria]